MSKRELIHNCRECLSYLRIACEVNDLSFEDGVHASGIISRFERMLYYVENMYPLDVPTRANCIKAMTYEFHDVPVNKAVTKLNYIYLQLIDEIGGF